MRKFLLAGLAAAGLGALARKVAQGRAEQDLWREATDPVVGAPTPAASGPPTPSGT